MAYTYTHRIYQQRREPMSVKGDFGSGKSVDQIARGKYDGNPGGAREEGRLVRHVDLEAGKSHTARYTKDLKCSKCGKDL